jgi:hypothetical protein
LAPFSQRCQLLADKSATATKNFQSSAILSLAVGWHFLNEIFNVPMFLKSIPSVKISCLTGNLAKGEKLQVNAAKSRFIRFLP